MKLYQTKNVLFYRKPTIASRMAQLIHEHKDKYGKWPRRIYVTEKEWDLYEQELPPQIRANYDVYGYKRLSPSWKYPRPSSLTSRASVVYCLSYRGIPVVRIEDWKRLVKSKK